MKWLVGVIVALAGIGGIFYWAVLDGASPPGENTEFDLAAYRALVAGDAPETLPSVVNFEVVGASEAPGFAAMAGAFSPRQRTFVYGVFQIVAPQGDVLVDGAVDQATLDQMSGGKGRFDQTAYDRVLAAMARANAVTITHEHLDHVMAIARHPEPTALAPRLRLTRPQLDRLAEHAVGGRLAPEIVAIEPIDLAAPQRIAPGVVAAAAPGHSVGEIVIYMKTPAREYLLIGDIAWVFDSVAQARGRPRFIRWIVPGVDPDRPRVLRQLRSLQALHQSEPELVILPAHDDAYLRDLIGEGVLGDGIVSPALAPAPK